MPRTLRPDDRIARYHVVGPLGSGGMGEVHSARDEELGRSVALKVLPPDLVRNEERVRRFVTEARSASALNHPNIITIYEIGHDVVRSEGEAASAEKIHYIAMELVAGDTLGQKIYRDRTDLRTLVGYLAQAADGVAKAHAVGVVHRDLKPGNIMVSTDGFAKVLDFGLAKLVEAETGGDGDGTSGPTAAAATRAGMLLGTVGYMSPEQVRGKPVDHRSDIFSMGVILYEATTRRRPFVADSDIEVMHQILRDKPPAVEELNPEVPAALQRVIRRCLAKNPEQRFQSMKDLAFELREIADEWESLNVAGSSAQRLAPDAAGPPPSGRGRKARLAVGGAILVLAAIGAGLVLRSLGGEAAPPVATSPAEKLQTAPLMSRNDLREATLSADGRYLAYVTRSGRFDHLHIRQVRTGSDVTILEDSDARIADVSFSRDGDYLYFRMPDPDLPNYSGLFRVPSLGGAPAKVLFDVDSAVTFSPGGRRVCFRRGVPQDHADSLVIADLASGEETEFMRVDNPTQLRAAPAWSPDGGKIAVGLRSIVRGAEAWVEVIDVETGERARLGEAPWLEINDVGWLGDGGALAVSAFDFAAGNEPQIYRLSAADGRVARITSDLDGYPDFSISADGETIAAVRRSTVSNLWVARVDVEDDATPLTFASGSAASMAQLAPLPGDATVFSAPRDNRFVLWRMAADGSDRRQLTEDGVWIFDISWTETNGIVFSQVVTRPEVEAHVWHIDPDGTGLEQLTHGESEQLAAVSPDGTRLLFKHWSRPGEIWALGLDGSEPRLFAEDVDSVSGFSPDGERVLLTRIEAQGEGRFYPVRQVLHFDGGATRATFRLPPGAFDLEWSPDGEAVTFIDRSQGWNLMRKRLPDGPAEPLTSFAEGQLIGHEWHRDGSRVALHRRFAQKESLWQLETGRSEPTLIVEYMTGRLSRYRWAPDAPLLYYAYSTSTQDVVMMTGVR